MTLVAALHTSLSRCGSQADREIIRGDGEGKGERDTSQLSGIQKLC